ncbi:MAG: M48 family metallopeptidase [Phycisphaerales bacterium]|jgi:predicted Zn-dependent protease|nr:M48 family metallopeptidase [Phycisphaerales bacterium]
MRQMFRPLASRWLVRLAAIAPLALASLVLPACSTNPATGRQSLTAFGWDWDKQVGLESGPQMTAEFGGATPDPVAQAYVQEVGRKLTDAAIKQAYAKVPDMQWNYTLLDSQVLNAFALPGGQVYFSRGLADKLENEAQMAGVLGHEVGHVIARHGAQRMTQQLGLNALVIAGTVAVGVADEDSTFRKYGQYGVPALAVGGNVVMLSYGRDEEMEADALGMQYMAESGWNPAAQRRVMQILGELSGAGSTPEWLSTHPTSETRIRRIDELLRGVFAGTQNNPDFVLNAPAYKTRMLDRLAKLPPARHGVSGARLDTPGTEPMVAAGAFELSNPVTWCGHCRAEAARRAAH